VNFSTSRADLSLRVPARQPCQGDHDGPAQTQSGKQMLLRGYPLEGVSSGRGAISGRVRDTKSMFEILVG
jgi:hypothetical protein